jgi:hypothetical protein
MIVLPASSAMGGVWEEKYVSRAGLLFQIYAGIAQFLQ